MAQLLKDSTNVVRYFMMRLVADGTAATGLTPTTFDLQYTRELTASATKIDGIVGTGGATTHVDNKVFEVEATDSPGLYMVCFPDAAFATGVDQVTLNVTYDATVFTEAQNIQLVAFDPFDAVRMGMTALPNAVAEAAGGLIVSTAGTTDADDCITATGFNTGGKTGYSLTAVTGLGNQTSNITGNLSGSVGSVTGNVDGNVTGSVASNLELGPAEVNTEVDNAIETYHLHRLLHSDYDPASKPGTATALLNELVENNGGVSRYTAAALVNAPGGTPNSPLLQTGTITVTSQTEFVLSAGSADDDAYNNQMVIVTDQATGEQKAVGHIAAVGGYVGSTKTVTLEQDPGVYTMATGDTFDIWAITNSVYPIEVDANGRVDVSKVAGTTQTPGDLAAQNTAIDSVVDGIQTDLSNGVDGLGALSTDIAAVKAETALILTDTNAVIVDLDNGTDGLGALSTDIAAVKAETALIVADTNELQTDNIPGTLATMDTKLDNIETDTGTTLDAAIAALQTDLDTLTDARGEPAQGAPGVSESMLVKIDYLYKAWRNRVTQTATQYSVYNDAGTVVDHKAVVSDDTTTADKGEVISGV